MKQTSLGLQRSKTLDRLGLDQPNSELFDTKFKYMGAVKWQIPAVGRFDLPSEIRNRPGPQHYPAVSCDVWKKSAPVVTVKNRWMNDMPVGMPKRWMDDGKAFF